MEFKKVRERSKEERARTRPPTTVPTTAPTSAATTAPVTAPPQPATALASAPAAASMPPTSAPRDADPATAEPMGSWAPRGATLRPQRAHVDPLADFLAAYDDGAASDETLPVEAPVEDERRFLTFELAGEAYAANIMDVREILKLVALTEVPRAPAEVLGVLSKRGVVMPVVDLASLLGLRAPDPRIAAEQRVLVVHDEERIVGLRVDRVRQVVRLGSRAIEDVPPSLGSKNAHMLLGLGRARIEGSDVPQMLILLDIEAVLAQLAIAVGIEARAAHGKRGAHA